MPETAAKPLADTIAQAKQTLAENGVDSGLIDSAIKPIAEAAGSDPVGAKDRFQSLLDVLMAGQFDVISAEDWTFLAIQGAMRVALVLIILFAAITIAGWAGSMVRTSLTKLKFDATLSKFFAKFARWSVLLLAGLTCLNYFGVPTTVFSALIGATGFAVGLAFQGTLSNFAAGAMLLLFRPFKVGDAVNIAGQLGKVDEIELFTTAIDTFDNRRIILPNSEVFGSTIENITHHPVRRVDVEVGADYAADIDQTREVLERVVKTTEGVLATPEPAVVLVGLGGSSVDWKVQGWAPTGDYLAVKQAITRAVKYALDDAGIGIPFPQMDIHVKRDSDAD